MSIVLHIVFGLLFGYAVVSLLESAFHRAIYHADPRTRRLWARYPLIGGPFRRAYFSHGIVHHCWTFRRDFVTQFTSEHERARLDRRIQGTQSSLIRREHYGMTLRGVGIVWFNLPILPFVLLIGLVLGPWGLVGVLPALAAYKCLAMFVHPYLHRPYDKVADAPPILRRILETGYVQFLRRHHYLHHQYPDCNFNLVLGGDVVLGRYRVPTAQDRDEMCRLGLVVDESRRQARSTPIHDV
ncbi:MAG: hypothetical protein OEY77_15235 [Nitrospira sp.]|nr:hypothetical protein [Nitrospira sp.]